MALALPLAERGIDLALASPAGGDLEEKWKEMGLRHLPLDIPERRGIRAPDDDGGGGGAPRAGQLATELLATIAVGAEDRQDGQGRSTSSIRTACGPTSTVPWPGAWPVGRSCSTCTTSCGPGWAAGSSPPRPATVVGRRLRAARRWPSASVRRGPAGCGSWCPAVDARPFHPGARRRRDAPPPHLVGGRSPHRHRGPHRPREGGRPSHPGRPGPDRTRSAAPTWWWSGPRVRCRAPTSSA